MQFLKITLLAALSLVLATFASAQTMSDAERDAFRAEVRAYLLDNPEVILEAIQVLEERQAEAESVGDLQLVIDNYEELTNDGYSFVAGNPEGAITIVEFSDYRCAFCKRAHDEVLGLLAANDDVRLVLKEFPILGPDSTFTAKAALSILVYQNEFYEEFNDSLMRHSGPVNDRTMSRVAKDIGADPALMLAHMDDPVVTQMITKNHVLGQRMQISGTPTFVIGPEMVRGFLPQAGMQQYVDAARAQLRN